jgi:hypothetical protein
MSQPGSLVLSAVWYPVVSILFYRFAKYEAPVRKFQFVGFHQLSFGTDCCKAGVTRDSKPRTSPSLLLWRGVLGKHILLCIWTSVDGIFVMLGKIPGNQIFKHEMAFIFTWGKLLKDTSHLLYSSVAHLEVQIVHTCLANCRPNFPVSLWCKFLLLCSTWTNALKQLVYWNVQSWNCCISICIAFRYPYIRTSQMALHTPFTIIPILYAGIERYESPRSYK